MRYATPTTWARYFKEEEGYQITDVTIRTRLRNTKSVGVKARDKIGRVFTFYSESAVREACANILVKMPQANKEGFFELDGESYGSIGALAKKLNTSHSNLEKIIKNIKLQGITAKDIHGVIRQKKYYKNSEALKIAVDMSNSTPQADSDGFFRQDGEKYGSTTGWSKELKISETTIKKKLKIAKSYGITAMDTHGRLRENAYFSESIIQEVLSDLLVQCPQANKEGCIELDSVKYACANVWARYFKKSENITIGERAIRKQLKIEGVSGITGRDAARIIRIKAFYSEADVREACADLLQDLPRADESGFFEKEGVRYGTLNSLAKVLGAPRGGGMDRKIKSIIQPIKGRIKSGNIVNFYPEPAVREACADLLDKKKNY